MAQAKTFKFGKAYILLGDGATPTEAFAAPCGFENLTMTINIETSNVNIPDCSDPDLAAWLATDVISKQMTLEGSGVLDTDAMQIWQTWWLDGGPNSDDERNVRFFRDLTNAEGGGYLQAPATLTAYQESAQRGQRWQNQATITLNGKPTWVPA